MSPEFRRGGRKVSLDQFMHDLERDVVDLGSSEIERRVWATRCPVHATAPTSVRQVGTRSDPQWEIGGCCQRLRDEIDQAF